MLEITFLMLKLKIIHQHEKDLISTFS